MLRASGGGRHQFEPEPHHRQGSTFKSSHCRTSQRLSGGLLPVSTMRFTPSIGIDSRVNCDSSANTKGRLKILLRGREETHVAYPALSVLANHLTASGVNATRCPDMDSEPSTTAYSSLHRSDLVGTRGVYLPPWMRLRESGASNYCVEVNSSAK